MNWYLLFLSLLLAAFTIVMARHSFLRARFFLHIFQQKGYKLHEFWHWLVDHWSRRVITVKHIVYLIILVVMLWLISTRLTGSAAIIILTFFGFFWFGPFNYYRGERQKKPLVFTARMIRLCFPYGIFCLIMPVATMLISYHPHSFEISSELGYLPVDVYLLAFGWVLADVIVPFYLFMAAKIMAPVEHRVHQHFIDEARSKINQMDDLTIVAITGSYGKTSTKFMIRDLLAERMSVCATPGSYNTPMGICKVINNDLQTHHRVLILEMGARYEGNIDELCDIAEPNISVITNVGIAHLETFGSRDAIAKTKATLVRRLTPGGTAVLNNDDERVAQMATLRGDVKIVNAGLRKGVFQVDEIRYDERGTRFKVQQDEQAENFTTSLLGAHNVQNMLLAMGVASCFNIRLKTMAVAAQRIKPVEHRLQLIKEGALTIIDDAFNSNPTGAQNAVEILGQFDSGRRVIITPGMIELGELEAKKNRIFGRQIGEANLDLVILVGLKRSKPILEGLHQTELPDERIKVVDSLFEANDIIQKYAKPGDVVLYENDLPDSFDE